MSARQSAAVLGSPVAHSLSPVLHGAAYRALGLDIGYERIECDEHRLPGLVRSAGPEWIGFSVTMPGKAAAAAVADETSDLVGVLGVANTLSRTDDGRWRADNTDVAGVQVALRAAGVTAPRTPLVLGSGHTARAALAALAGLGTATATVAARRPAPALAVADALGIECRAVGFDVDTVASVAGGADLVVSTVPAGVADPLAGVLAGVPALLDAIYHPWPTALAAAGSPGRTTVTGLDMLLHQAVRQVEIFTGLVAPAAVMRRALLDATGADLPLPL